MNNPFEKVDRLLNDSRIKWSQNKLDKDPVGALVIHECVAVLGPVSPSEVLRASGFEEDRTFRLLRKLCVVGAIEIVVMDNGIPPVLVNGHLAPALGYAIKRGNGDVVDPTPLPQASIDRNYL